MNRDDVVELYFITHIENVPSILRHGILSHKESQRIAHKTIAMREIQERRKNKQIPGAGRLHDYVNLYFDAHNPMLSKVRDHNDVICILTVDPVILDLKGVIIADKNASSDWVRFGAVSDGLEFIDKEKVFAKYWTHQDDPFQEMEHKSIKCAEVLIPERVDPEYIKGSYVANQDAFENFEKLKTKLRGTIKSDIFFW